MSHIGSIVDKVLVKLEETVSGFEGKIISTDKIGRKKLAYDIKNFRDGFFVSQVLSLPEKFIDISILSINIKIL